jgi:hypothetical protein
MPVVLPPGRARQHGSYDAALTMLKIGTSFSEHELAQTAKGWFLNDLRDQQTWKYLRVAARC